MAAGTSLAMALARDSRERQLAKNNAELRWLNEQKNQLLGMAAHDLRNPLAESGTVRLDPVELTLGELLSDVEESNKLVAEKKEISIVSVVDRDIPRVRPHDD